MTKHKRRHVTEILRERVVSALRFGAIDHGTRLPSARTLAVELHADPRVVVAAYLTLEQEGLVERRPPSRAWYPRGHATAATGSATTRSSDATDSSAVVSPIHTGGPASIDWLADVLAQSLERDLAVSAFAEYAWRATATLRLRALCIECNRDQLVWLCRELEEDYGIETSAMEVDALPTAVDRAHHAPELQRADLLVTTEDHADQVWSLARRLGRPCIVVKQRADLIREVEQLLAVGTVYFVGTDPRFAAKLRAHYAGRCDPAHVQPVLVAASDAAADVSRIPARAPAYVMRTARDLLGGIPAQVRPLATLRAFSRDTRLEILRFMVRKNQAAMTASVERR
jgi:hypothetical protein